MPFHDSTFLRRQNALRPELQLVERPDISFALPLNHLQVGVGTGRRLLEEALVITRPQRLADGEWT